MSDETRRKIEEELKRVQDEIPAEDTKIEIWIFKGGVKSIRIKDATLKG